MENKILIVLAALVVGPLVIPNLIVFIGTIGCLLGVKFMEMYLTYCKNNNIYIDPSGTIVYGIYGMILGFFGIFIFLIILFIIILIIFLLVKMYRNFKR